MPTFCRCMTCSQAGTQTLNEVFTITELCDSDLRKLCRLDVHLTPDHVNTLLYNLLVGVNYLHSAGIVHCGLRPANCMVNQDCAIKLCDFTDARFLLGSSQHAQGLSMNSPQEEASSEVPVFQTSLKRQRNLIAVNRCKWYLAPEILLIQETTSITALVDIWSVGCIYAELIGMLPGRAPMDRGPLFPSTCHIRESWLRQQLQKIISILGSPSDADLEWLDDEEMRSYVQSLEAHERQVLAELLPPTADDTIALLEQLLEFSPTARVSARDALNHAALSYVRDASKEVLACHRVQLASLEGALDEKALRTCFC